MLQPVIANRGLPPFKKLNEVDFQRKGRKGLAVSFPLIATSRVQDRNILWPGATGFRVVVDTILMLVTQSSKSIHFKGQTFPFPAMIVTRVFAKEIV